MTYITEKDIVTRDVQLNGPGRKLFQYIGALAASLSALSTGTVLAWTSQISKKILDGELGFPISVAELGWIGSLMPLGAAFLSIFAGSISDVMGRKITMLIFIIPITIGWALIIWANSVTMIYFGRILSGAVAGMYCVLAPMYSTEIAQKEIRGALGCFTQLNIAFGVLATTILGKYLSIKLYTIVCGILPLIFGAVFVFMPESPFYLLKKGKEEEARKSLKFLRGSNYNIDLDLKEIKDILQERGTISLKAAKESLKKKATKKALVIALGLMLFRVLCGVDAITAYATYIMEFADLQMDYADATIILFAIQTIFGIVQAFLVDSLGRKVLLLISSATTTLSVLTVGIIMNIKNNYEIDEDTFSIIQNIPIIALGIFYAGYALGLGPIPWMIVGEIFPQEIKSIASSFANFTSWITTFIVVKLFLVIQDEWGSDVIFLLLGVISCFGFVLLYLTVHETKGKSLAQIQEELGA